MAGVTVFALISYIVMPEEAWLPRNRLSHFIDSKGVAIVESEVGGGSGSGGEGRGNNHEEQHSSTSLGPSEGVHDQSLH